MLIITNNIIMKKTFTTLSLLSLTIVAFAQPTLTATNFSPVIGDSQLYYIADSNSVLDNTVGANVIFDYSGLQGFGATQTSRFVNPATTTFASDFPLATYSDTTDGSAVNKRYAQLVGSDSLVNSGLVLNINSFGVTVVKFDANPEITMKFPFNFGDSFTDVYAGQFTNTGTGISTNGNGVVNVVADAWGTLKMPNMADITSVIRVVQIDTITTDTIILPPPFPPILPLRLAGKIISYYKPSLSKFALLSFVEGNNAGQTTRTVISQFPLPTVSIKELENEIGLTLFPNPTNNKNATLQFNLTKTQSVEVAILNQLGQKVVTIFSGTLASGSNRFEIDTHKLSKGIYFVNMNINSQLITKKLVVQ